MDFKTYKIGEMYQNEKCVPTLRLNGKWLEALNFYIGERVIVYQSEDMLVITKPSAEEQKILDDKRKEKEQKKIKRKSKTL